MITELTSLKRRYIDTRTAGIPDDLADLREEVAEFVTYPDVAEWAVNWEQNNIDFLQEVGLPGSAPTMIEFRSPADVDPEFVNIGFNNYGDPIAVAKANGNIVYINHDCDNRIEYMNHDAVSLFKSICAFADMMAGHTAFTEKLTGFDPDATREGRWWQREHAQWLNSKK